MKKNKFETENQNKNIPNEAPSQELQETMEGNATEVQEPHNLQRKQKAMKSALRILLVTLVMVGAYYGVKKIVRFCKERKEDAQLAFDYVEEPYDGPIVYEKGNFNIVNPSTKRTLVKNIEWHHGTSRDSIILFAKNGKRGFCDIVNNNVIVPATTYTKAWIFSEGLAAVEKDGRIGFVNTAGKLVIPCRYAYRGNSLTEFVFHNGHCVVADSCNKIGAINTKGQWVIQPIYDAVELTKDYAIVYTKGAFKKQIDYNGNILQDGIVDAINNIYYDITYTDAATGAPQGGSMKNDAFYTYQVGSCVGLINNKGVFITAPIYTDITGIGPTIFCATLQDRYSKVLIDENGNVVSRKR